MTFVGALSFGDEPWAAYGQPGARNQAGIAIRPGPDRLRLEFPEPEFESAFDILDMERVKPARK